MTVVALPTTPLVQNESDLRRRLAAAIGQVNALVLGKDKQVRLAFACVLAGEHLLLEDIPGTGKTILARAMAGVMALDFKRIQFTSDLMPSDIVGVSIYQPQNNRFELHHGPVFTNILLADEINRATPRAQSALLEAMAEGQVSIDRTTHKLPAAFLVFATQNPTDQSGTFPLPHAQRDRFMFQVSMGYPDRGSELALMRGERRGTMIEGMASSLTHDDVMALRQLARHVRIEDSLMGFAHDLVQATRTHPQLDVGLSPRASLALVDAARALAVLSGRSYAIPEDFQEAFPPLAIHRIQGKLDTQASEQHVIDEIVRTTPTP